MVRTWGRVGLVLAVLVLSAQTADAGPRARRPVITRPDWAEKPTGDDLARFFPDRAQAEYQSGSATIACVVKLDGGLTECEVERESPKGYGFGAAALSLSAMFRMKPKTIDGVAVEGGSVTIPIVFGVPRRPELGDGALVLTPIDPAARPTSPDALIVPCPYGSSECLGRIFEWASRPSKAQASRILALASGAERETLVLCAVEADGSLSDCLFTGDRSKGGLAAAQEAVKLLRAPGTTSDGAATAETLVMVPFDWPELGVRPSKPKP